MPSGSKNPLAAFSVDQLLEEIQRRRNLRTLPPVEDWCEDCKHFAYAKDDRQAEDPKFNPCTRGHRMAFAMPNEADGPHGPSGYYRRVCVSRSPR